MHIIIADISMLAIDDDALEPFMSVRALEVKSECTYIKPGGSYHLRSAQGRQPHKGKHRLRI
jgi:hypothetical protein